MGGCTLLYTEDMFCVDKSKSFHAKIYSSHCLLPRFYNVQLYTVWAKVRHVKIPSSDTELNEARYLDMFACSIEFPLV